MASMMLIGHNLLVGQTNQLVIMSYNVENLMDTIDNPTTADEEFTPSGRNVWTHARYYDKLKHIAEVISRAGETEWPALVGLVEVENASVLDDLLSHTGLGKRGYRYIITDGNDPRGIDVALLYRTPLVTLEGWSQHAVHFTEEGKRSRDLLIAELRLSTGDTLTVGVAHLPSRRGGAQATEVYRREAAYALRQVCDSLYDAGRRHFILMGDFNGEPSEPATRVDLGASLELPESSESLPRNTLQLYSLIHQDNTDKDNHYGTYCYRGVWSQLDHLIISSSLLDPRSRVHYLHGSAKVYAPDYLCTRDAKTVAGQALPWRTYRGPHYDGGYSDHFPVLLRLGLIHRED